MDQRISRRFWSVQIKWVDASDDLWMTELENLDQLWIARNRAKIIREKYRGQYDVRIIACVPIPERLEELQRS